MTNGTFCKNKVLQGDSAEILSTLQDNIFDCCVTSPPYYGLRDYGNEKQIGLEDTPEQYIERLVKVFEQVKRTLKDNGTLWLNIGDTYENKSLIGIPWLLAFALKKSGWYLRQDIIWHKPNPMPESVKDRCVKSHEYIFLFSKSQQYYFDYKAIQEDAICKDDRRAGEGRIEYDGKRANGEDDKAQQSFVKITDKRNKRDVWTVTTKAVKDAHFATYPEDLIKPCILAGCKVGGVVLDPFFGSGTTGRVCIKTNRDYFGIELNPDYIDIINKRTDNIQLTFEGLI